MPATAAIYCRISRDAEGEAVGVANQEATCRALAEAAGLEVVKVYTDNDRGASSLSKKSRPDFEAMVRAATEGEFGTIIAYSMSRVTRRPKEWETLIDLAGKQGVRFLYKVSPEYDLSTADGRATARTVAAWDAAEAERTGERVRHALAAKVAKGVDPGGNRPFGFEPSRMEIREPEAQYIREAYRRVLDEGQAIYAVAKWLSTEGVPTAGTAELWTPRAVRALLMRPRNAGMLVVKGQEVEDSKLPAIVTRERYEEMMAVLSDPDRKPKRGRRAQALLSGIATCSVCGYSLTAATSRKGKRKDGTVRAYEIYRCSNNQPVGRGTHPSIQREILDAKVEVAVIEHFIHAKDETPSLDALSMDAVAAELRDLDERKQDVLSGLQMGLKMSDLREHLQPILDAQKTAEERRDAILRQSVRARVIAQVSALLPGSWLATGLRIGSITNTLPLDQKRELIRALFDVTLEPGSDEDRVKLTPKS
ncbi:recombinase family protein [Microbacterium sp. EYE_5]|uniref:recombinase family protein n=1 Tax=unclassified Microbacterium TaxID=2609290 RepID=UPI002004E9FA|nr:MULTISPECIES: recombinase family protein [unclassified Microbacterium]MCK6080098.1 recombinase family protein [Microbacterium sp. EYE_382]MCK6085369.1 recombinase family protein [Microbacterium sp. EYE_384]MCK6122406.1 recombinase family protein [Microbacterium sp. EYE_80]MCK6126132.1 recombinase family protein [Microbacterium sp. EYE_79]MCK6141053.1 recombinase family protein [Microbacterium sp. EYE_39]